MCCRLGLDLHTLSHAQLDALDEMHQALQRSITEHRIQLSVAVRHPYPVLFHRLRS